MLYFTITQIHRRPFLNPVIESMVCSQFEYINRTIHFVMALHDFVLRINAILVTSIYLCLQFSKVTLRDSFLRQVPTIPVACRLTNSQARNYLTSEGSVKPPNTNAGYFCLRVYFYLYLYLPLQICIFRLSCCLSPRQQKEEEEEERYCLTRESESRPKPGKQETTTKTTPPVLHSRVCCSLP